jgi:HD-GYP domain-containing protein (c-di-GMP phosphodiesterase class II)
MIIDTIFVYGRKLFDSEFDLIKEHPSVGYRLLSSHSSTKKYADVARGHHLWFDGSRGYPLDFDVAASPLKAIIDIVMIADCMDAATDSVGRSYNKGKTLSDYEKEVQEGAGTRYAPWGVELLADEKTRQDLEYLLTKERLNLYAETYRLLSSL